MVGVYLEIAPFPGAAKAVEFSAIGTAVRARGSYHPRSPFLSDVSGQDFAKLVHSGWVPCGLAFGVAVGVRHDDWDTRQATRSWSNAEVPGYTDLVQHVRAKVRSDLAADVVRQGGTGVVLREMDLRITEQECQLSEGNLDHVAQATVVGTAIVPFTRTSPDALPPSLTILRLDAATASIR